MIGNDVIDLVDPDSQPGRQHRRFDKLAFTCEERRVLRRMGNSHTQRWCMWAAKEAAYKLLKQTDSSISFAPRRFEVSWQGHDRCTVVHKERTAWVQLRFGNDYVHALALSDAPSDDQQLPPVAIIRLDAAPQRPPSIEIRKLVKRMASLWLGQKATNLKVVTEEKIPRLVDAKGDHCGYLSLSHHGRYMAFTLLDNRHDLVVA